MDLFILHSRPRLFALVVAMIGSYLAGAAYTLWLNPEVQFWKAAYAITSERAQKISETGKKKIVLAGDSSCSFQLDGNVLSDEFGLPTINRGIHAGVGVRAQLAMATPLLKWGDIFVLHFQPELMTEGAEISQMGYQALVATGALWQQNDSLLKPLGSYPIYAPFLALRPGLYNAVTMIGKIIMHRPIYRYSKADIDASGTMSTAIRNDLYPERNPRVFKPDTNTEKLFEALAGEAKTADIKMVYILPAKFVETSEAEEWRKASAQILAGMGHYFEILDDGRFGADPHAAAFADTTVHFTQEERRRKTRALGESLRAVYDHAK